MTQVSGVFSTGKKRTGKVVSNEEEGGVSAAMNSSARLREGVMRGCIFRAQDEGGFN